MAFINASFTLDKSRRIHVANKDFKSSGIHKYIIALHFSPQGGSIHKKILVLLKPPQNHEIEFAGSKNIIHDN